MDSLGKNLEQIAHNTQPKIEAHMNVVTDESSHEKKFSQSFITNNNQLIKAIICLTGCDGTFNISTKSKKNLFHKINF